MKHMTIKALGLIILVSGYLYADMQSLPEENRAVPFCTTCPTGAVQFCNLCVPGEVVVGDLTVQGTLTLCNGSSGPTGCACVYDGSLSWNTQETNFNRKDWGFTGAENLQTTNYVYAGTNTVISGWSMPPASSTGPNLTISAEFEIPKDLDPSVAPVVTLHWFNPPFDPVFSPCAGNLINWEVVAGFFVNDQPVDFSPPPYQVQTGDIVVNYGTGFNLRQQQVDVVLATGPAFVPGAYGVISATRVPPSIPEAESDCFNYLSVIGLTYRKAAQ